MLINQKLSQEIYNDAGETKRIRAKDYLNQGKINIIKADYENQDNFSVASIVIGKSEDYRVDIEVQRGELKTASCECMDYFNNYSICKHILATLMRFEQTKFWDHDSKDDMLINKPKDSRNLLKYKNFNNMINSFYNDELAEINSEESSFLQGKDKIKIEVKLEYDKFSYGMKLEFKIGNSRMYKLKDLTEFYTRMTNNEYAKYGDKLEFIHNRENFEENSKDILDFILKYAEIMKYSSVTNRYNYYGSTFNKSSITLGESTLDEAFDILKNKKVQFTYDYSNTKLEFIEQNPNIEFDLAKINEQELTLRPNIDIFRVHIFKGKEFTYLLDEDKLYRCDKEFSNSSLKLIKSFRENYTSEMLLRKEDLKDFCSIVMPKISNSIKIQGMQPEELDQYRPEKLAVKVFLDFDKDNFLTMDARFCYGDEEFNPLEQDIKIKALRNELEENRNLNIFKKTGFMLDTRNTRFILPDDEKIYDFLSEEINYYMQKFEVMVTDNFKTKQIRDPKIGTLGVKVENNLLNIDLSKINITPEEIADVMEKYKLKKKFHRLKNGTFLNLDENEDIEFLDKLTSGMDIKYQEIKNNIIKLPVNRSLYLNELLKKFKTTKSTKNYEYKKLVENLEKENLDEQINIPESFNAILRDYQKLGFRWLKTLDNYKFGGILADDMGLGKTIQILSIILAYINEEKEKRKTSIVISPSSLALNWLQEASKFAPSLKVKVISGTANERSKIIQQVEKYDLIITSYDLLKRDREKYEKKDYTFKYIIADEAQYLKNSNTQNAKTIKDLKGETRFALTGTPIENSLAELWSIFDFVMPGYLFSYKKFKTNYEMPIVRDNDKREMEKLKLLIEPFVLRRTKKQVLTELPEKTVTILNNEMNEEQKNIYLSYLMRARNEIQKDININGISKNHIQILAALTRLRQICCHPGLFIENYNGTSSKLEQCMEIIEEGINAGHKILLFSTYTSIFPFIEEKLNEKNIKYFKLTGATKVDERLKLVDEFNENSDVKVFLISLKAGGTGLNLIGADMVIHYDPWWNLSAENQATDRAYRIGQKNNVQVYKLITKDSIEEKIYDLQNKKGKLTENMLDTKTTFISKLSKEEIMNLFN